MASKFKEGYKAEALHTYTDIEGDPLYWKIRLIHEIEDKYIRPMTLINGVYVLKEPVFSNGKPLYNLHKFKIDLDKTVFIVEGEKCADALVKLGLLATTSGGADSVKTTDWQTLAGREVVIWRDNDNAGLKYQNDIIEILHLIQCKIKCIDVAALNLPVKGDCVDWLADFERLNNRKAESSDIFNLPTNEDVIQAPASDYLVTGEPLALPDNSTLTAPEPKRTDDEVIAWLATLKPLDYDRARNEQAKVLKVRPCNGLTICDTS